jgi:trk system potassium uptake protein TrkH
MRFKQIATVLRLSGVLLMLYSIGFLPSIVVSVLYADGQVPVFAWSMSIAATAGFVLWFPFRRAVSEFSIRGGFVFVSLFWMLLGVIGALPFMIGLHLDFTDAVFESISGFTTTGATVISGLDNMPRSILYHRQQIQFLGGMGIVVLAVALLPLLKIGGMQLYQAETSGIAKSEKMTPRISETARVLWVIYSLLTLACALAFWAAGMSLFDAICHAFATVATGGFSPHDASIAWFESPLIESVAMVFMMAGGINFAAHFMVWKHHDVRAWWRDEEVRTFFGITGSMIVVVALTLWLSGTYTMWTSLRHGGFMVVSVITSTGFGTEVFAHWPLFLPLLFMVISFVGSCAGSTSGGIKVVRILLVAKLAARQLFLLVHPRAVKLVRLGDRTVPDDILLSVLGFLVLYVGVSVLLTLAMMAAGLDLVSAAGAVQATINLCGPGLGGVAVTFADTSDAVKWLGSFAMLVGRLEVFTLLVLLMPSFWRH